MGASVSLPTNPNKISRLNKADEAHVPGVKDGSPAAEMKDSAKK